MYDVKTNRRCRAMLRGWFSGGATVLAVAACLAGQLAASAVDAATAGRRAAADAAASAAGSEPSYPMELWKDPTFRKQFMGSYGVRSGVEPKVSENERKTLADVMALMSEEKLNEARRKLEAATTPSSTAVFDFVIGNVYFQNEELEKAATWYRQAVDKFPNYLRAHKNLGLVSVRNGQFKDAVKPLTRTLELGGREGLVYGLLGFTYSTTGNHISAESAYRQAIMLQPDSKDWQIGLAQALFKQEKYAEAATLCGQLIAGMPDNTQLWRLQANAYLGMGKPMKAAQNFEYLRMRGEVKAPSLNTLGDIYVNERMMDAAAEAYTDALKKNPGQVPDRPIRNARILARRGALDAAETLIQAVREAYKETLPKEKDTELLRLQARVAAQKGASEKQVELLERIVQMNPTDGEALILLGRHYARTGDPERAVFYYERAEGIEDVEAKAKIRHAQLLVQESKYQEAIPLLESALQIKHRDDVSEYLQQVRMAAKSRQ